MITITSYDLRYIRSGAADKTNAANWTVVTGIGTDDTGTYEITGLGPGVQYDVQVRALSNSSAGPWSESLVVRSSLEKPFVPSLTGVTPRDTGLGAAWTAPTEDGGSEITSYDLRTIRSDASQTDKDDPTRWAESISAWTTGGGDRQGRVAGLTNGVQYDVQVRATNAIGTSDWSGTRTGMPAIQNTDASFADDTADREVAENLRVGVNVGARVSATDPDRGDPLTYSILGGHHLFEIDAMNGQLRTKAVLDADEGVTSHTLTVEVSDMLNSSDDEDPTIDDSIVVMVTVEDVNEQPEVMGTRTIDHAENEGTALANASYSATDPEGANIIWSVGGIDKGFFAISSDGVLSFADDPDFEARPHDNIYEVTVEATEEDDGDSQTRELTGSLAVTVTLSDFDEPPEIDGPASVMDYPENSLTTRVVGRYRATDPEGAGVTWSALTGDDADDFEFSNAGVLTFKASPNFEMKDEYSVTLNAFDGDLTGSVTVTVTITNVNEPPMVARRSGTGEFSIVENSGTDVGDFEATDPEGHAVTWSLASGGDSRFFEIDETSAALSFKESEFNENEIPDYESTGLGSDKAYNVTVQATEEDDGDALMGSLAVTVRITNVNEPPVVRRSSGAGAFSIVENSGTDVGDFEATDPEGHAVTWSLASGGDSRFFEIDETSAALSFKESEFNENEIPDYESTGLGSDKAYNVTVQATEEDDGDALMGSLAVTVRITNVNEPPVVRRSSGAGAFSIVENSGTDVGRFVATDPEGAGVTWSDLSGDDADDFDLSNNGDLRFKHSPDYEMKREYEVTLNAFDGDLTGSVTVTVTITNVNEPPMVARRSGTGEFSIVENSGTDVGDFEATDPEEHAVTWSLASGGDSRFFEIDETSAALSFKESEFNENEIPDYESTGLGSDKAYNVTVQATEEDDGDPQTRELRGSLAVTVRITNVNEAPVITGLETVDWNENTAGTIATYRATDPEGVAVTWSLQGGPGVFMISSAGALSFASAPNYEVKSSYTVTVRASDGTNNDDHVVTVTVTDVNEREVLVLSHRTPLIGEEFTAAFEGTGDNVDSVQPPTWAWARSAMGSSSGWMPIIDATNATYEPTGDDRERYLRVTVSYNDGHSNDGHSAKTLSKRPPSLPRRSPTPSLEHTADVPGAPCSRAAQTGLSVRENAGVRTVVGVAPQATDMQGGGLTYSLAVSTASPPMRRSRSTPPRDRSGLRAAPPSITRSRTPTASP